MASLVLCSGRKSADRGEDASSFVLNRPFETWGSETAWTLQKATSKEIDRISEEFLGAGPFGIMINPLTYSSMTRRSAEGTAYTPSKLPLSVDKWGYNKPGTKVDVAPEIADGIRMWFLDASSRRLSILPTEISARAPILISAA